MATYPAADSGPLQLIRFNERTGDMEVIPCEDPRLQQRHAAKRPNPHRRAWHRFKRCTATTPRPIACPHPTRHMHLAAPQVREEAAALLRSIRTPIGVVAVCGRARTGKSFILNQLLGQSTGFRLAHSHRPCTKGLWIWSKPIRRVGPDGEPYHLVSPLSPSACFPEGGFRV